MRTPQFKQTCFLDNHFRNQMICIYDDYKTVAWAEVGRNNTIELIAVIPERRGEGFAVELIKKIIDLLIGTKSKLKFFDNNPGFWKAMKTKFPKNIFISSDGEGIIVP